LTALFASLLSLASRFAQLRGEAQAFAIEARAKAEAEQMTRKADAWREYKEAAMVDMFLDVLPKVCAFIQVPSFPNRISL